MDLKSIDLQGWLDWFAKNKDAFEAIDVILGILGILLIVPIYWVIKRFLKWIRSPAPIPKEEVPEATKTDNSQTQNFANQSGGNAAGRDVNINHYHTNAEGQERYRQSIERQVNDLTNRLERANQDKGALDADKRQLQSEINDLRAKLFDIEASFDAAKERADNLAAQLTAFSNQVDPEQLAQARELLAEFDFDGAERILTQIVNDQELNVRQSAAAHHSLGEIVEERVNWQDALDHYKRAYGQNATSRPMPSCVGVWGGGKRRCSCIKISWNRSQWKVVRRATNMPLRSTTSPQFMKRLGGMIRQSRCLIRRWRSAAA